MLLYDQVKEPLGVGKFKPMWHSTYIVRHVLEKGAYELEDYEGNMLVEPRNGSTWKDIMLEPQAWAYLFVY